MFLPMGIPDSLSLSGESPVRGPRPRRSEFDCETSCPNFHAAMELHSVQSELFAQIYLPILRQWDRRVPTQE